LNCAAVPAELIESELFGHEKGSFTGAGTRHLGKFEQAQGGTLFLDEIGDMPPVMQAKLLRVLEQKEIERIGGDRTIEVDVRVVVATHRNLDDLVRTGTFREDLYHRIYVFPITLPPLRERREDIRPLTDHFAASIVLQNDWRHVPIAAAAYEEMEGYAWPGNVRELRNVVERLLLLADSEVDASTVRLALPVAAVLSSSAPVAVDGVSGTLAERVERYERSVVLSELDRHGHRMTETARALGLERSHLYKKCQQLGIDYKSS
jgi:transcriptional regulator with GAF, ATPase, and Fis domain